jgi:hypothetical protein
MGWFAVLPGSASYIISYEEIPMIPKVKVDTPLADKLARLTCDAVIYDDQGRVLGYFSPIREPTRLEELQLEPPTSLEESEELRKRARANPGRPLEEILKELGY